MRPIEQDNLTTRPVDKVEKIKTPFAQVIVGGPIEKPCYSIMWWDVTDQEYNIGYSSYNLEFVFKWLKESFEVDDNMKKPHALTLDDLRPKGRWVNENGRCGCSECRQGIRSTFEGLEMWLDMSTLPFCPFCGADMRRSANSANLEEDGTELYGIEDIGVGENPGEPGV